jgi:protocatechuate 4,5-dioxygenase beta chain
VANIVGCFGVPHMPNTPGEARRDPNATLPKLFAEVRKHVDELNPDVIVLFDTDHFHTWFYDRMPTFAVGVAQFTSGPGGDEWPGMVAYDEVPVHEELARVLHRGGIERGFDLTQTQEFEVDHSAIVPLHFLNADMDNLRMLRPYVPVWVNGIAPPLPLAKRCYALGETLREVIEAWPSNLKVGVACSGAISGDIGGPSARNGPAGPPDHAWVSHVVGRMQRSEINELLNEATEERIQAAGNVTGEMLNWVALLGVAGGRKPVFLEENNAGGIAFGAWRWDR